MPLQGSPLLAGYRIPQLHGSIITTSGNQLIIRAKGYASYSGGRAAQPAEEKKICKQLPSSSSRLPNRVCLTEKGWKQVEDDASR